MSTPLVPILVKFNEKLSPHEGQQILKVVGLVHPVPVTLCMPNQLFTAYTQESSLETTIANLMQTPGICAAAPLEMVMEQLEKALVPTHPKEHSV